MQYLYGTSYVIANNSGVLTTGSSYTLPSTSGTTIKIICIGGGGGGGGGSSRPINVTGAGGGGADIRYATATVTAGGTVTYSIGAAGAQGGPRDGPFSGGASGGPGGTTSVSIGASVVVTAPGGGGGEVARLDSTPSTGGYAGSGGTGTQILTPNAGSNGNVTGGVGSGGASARGYSINTTVGATTVASYGAVGAGGIGQSNSSGQTGTTYGGGGGGGGNNGTNNLAGMNPAPGATGIVFIYWGY